VHRGVFLRKLRTVPIGGKPVWLEVAVPRVGCRKCGCVRRVHLRIADHRREYTRSFERHALSLAQVMPLKNVAQLLKVSWDTIKDIFKRYLRQRFSRPKLSRLRFLSIDEISVKKGHRYVTLVLDMESGAVVFVGDGKGAEALRPFWEMLRRSRAKIEAVSTDMSSGYIGSVLENLPNASLVVDHFHVVKLMNDALSEIRRGLYHELDAMGKKVLKGSRWILLKNPENLSLKRKEKEHLREALRLNEPLATAYYMKEDLRRIWSLETKAEASLFLADWIERARSSGIGPLKRIGKTLAGYRSCILNWYDHRVSSGKMEGTNNKIKVMKRMAYGFRDMEFFKLRILGIHEAKYALTG
jgi:transposase